MWIVLNVFTKHLYLHIAKLQNVNMDPAHPIAAELV